WSHELRVGRDATSRTTTDAVPRHGSPSDTLPFRQLIASTRRSINYLTTMRTPVTTQAHATVTAGVDGWQNLWRFASMRYATVQRRISADVGDDPAHAAGGFLQIQAGWRERVFLTYGVRAEWHPFFGAEVTPNMAPRYGAVFVQDFAWGTIKMRAAYGRATRP